MIKPFRLHYEHERITLSRTSPKLKAIYDSEKNYIAYCMDFAWYCNCEVKRKCRKCFDEFINPNKRYDGWKDQW